MEELPFGGARPVLVDARLDKFSCWQLAYSPDRKENVLFHYKTGRSRFYFSGGN
jgi:hypothetical protein